MSQFALRTRYLLLPFAVSSIVFFLAYSFFNWLLYIKLEVIPLTETTIRMGPLVLALIPLWFVMRKRIKLFQFKNDRLDVFYYLVAWIGLGLPTMLAQDYVFTATGKLTPLITINDFDSKNQTKYYSLSRYFVDADEVTFYTEHTTSGRHNETLNFGIYAVMPILEKKEDSIIEASYWMGIKYSEHVSNRLSFDEKKSRFEDFWDNTMREFRQTDFNNFSYLEREGKTEDRHAFIEAIKKSDLVAYKNPVVLRRCHGNFADRNGNTLRNSLIVWASIMMFWLLIILLPRAIDMTRLNKLKSGQKDKDSDLRETLFLILPRKGFVVVPLLFAINVLIYIAMVFSLGSSEFRTRDLFDWGARRGTAVLDGEWWRVLTSIFLHSGFIHLFFNMIGLLLAGIFLEAAVKSLRFLIIYIATGIAAGIVSLLISPSMISVGASGAIFGIYGLALSLLLLKVFGKDISKAFLTTLLIFIGFNLLIGFISKTSNTDNAAHIGGLLSGMLCGVIIAPPMKKSLTNPTRSKT